MKRIVLSLVLGAAVACPSLVKAADDAPPGPPPGEKGEHHKGAGLTDAEKAELKKAHDAAVAANPSLEAEGKAMHDKMKANHEAGTPPTEADKAAGKAFHEKMDAAMIKADPAVEPILKKLKEHHHHGGPGAGGPPPPPPSDT